MGSETASNLVFVLLLGSEDEHVAQDKELKLIVIPATPPRHPIEMPDLEAVQASNEAPDKVLGDDHTEVVLGHFRVQA